MVHDKESAGGSAEGLFQGGGLSRGSNSESVVIQLVSILSMIVIELGAKVYMHQVSESP